MGKIGFASSTVEEDHYRILKGALMKSRQQRKRILMIHGRTAPASVRKTPEALGLTFTASYTVIRASR